MRYVFISDVHGCFDKMIEALNSVNFDKEKDTLVNLGDPFDRGPSSKEVLEYLMSCPHRILVRGNHDARLQQLVCGSDTFAGYDFSNGVMATLKSFVPVDGFYGGDSLINLLNVAPEYKATCDLLWDYFHECVWCAEWKDLIAVHAWCPIVEKQFPIGRKYKLMEDWRHATNYDWYESSWTNSQNCAILKQYPDKPLIIGHWHAWRLGLAFGEDRYKNASILEPDLDCRSFVSADGRLVAIDGCSNYSRGGCVNAFVKEMDDEPIFYKGE